MGRIRGSPSEIHVRNSYFSITYTHSQDATYYEAASEIKYLDMVIQESLRLYPVAPRVVRVCNETTTVHGICFPKGTWVVIPVHALHRDPKNWGDPEKFDPLR